MSFVGFFYLIHPARYLKIASVFSMYTQFQVSDQSLILGRDYKMGNSLLLREICGLFFLFIHSGLYSDKTSGFISMDPSKRP